MEPRLAKQDTCKHALDAEAEGTLEGEAALLPAEWAEMAGQGSLGVWGSVGEGQREGGVESEKARVVWGAVEEMLK